MNIWMNAEHTLGNIIDGGHVVVVEQDHPRWGEFVASGPAPYVAPDPEPAPVPEKVSRYQARAALYGAGLLGAVDIAVAASDPLVQMAWADAGEFRRNSPAINTLGAALGLTDAQIDDLFRVAAGIEA